MLRSILLAAIIAGTLTGILFTGIQHLQLIPLILEAEGYEGDDENSHHAEQHEHAGTEHDTTGTALERNLFTLLANVLAGISFAMLLAGAIVLSGHAGWRKGLLWGVAGYLCFFVAPGLGLTPKLPGTRGAPVEYQQVWWLVTVSATTIGISLLVFTQHALLKVLGLMFIVMPHIVGAPLPEQPYSAAPQQLRNSFIIASALANIGFWISLGFLSGYLLRSTETGRNG
jgi:cobalt transporter subunit CbtA